MQILKCLSTLVLFFIVLPVFAGEAPVETSAWNNRAIYGYDTVAYFTDDKAVKGSKKIKHKWRGADWHFATEEHKALFVANPEKYAPQYGGYCAYAMSDGKLAGIDEEAFTIYNDKLYLNYSKSVRKNWRKDIDKYIAEADVFYPTLVDLPKS